MRIINFDPIYLQYSFDNYIFRGLNILSISYNVLKILKGKYNTLYIGNIDNQLKKIIDINYIDIDNKRNNRVFNFNKRLTSKCPYCNRNLNEDYEIDYEKILNKINCEDFIIYNSINEKMLTKLSNKSFLILDLVEEVENYSYDELINCLSNHFISIVISSNVINYLKNKFKIDAYDLYESIDTILIVVINSKEEIEFIFGNNIIEKELDIPFENNNYFISSLVSVLVDYLINDEMINDKVISSLFLKTNITYNKILNSFDKLYEIDTYDECICNQFELK